MRGLGAAFFQRLRPCDALALLEIELLGDPVLAFGLRHRYVFGVAFSGDAQVMGEPVALAVGEAHGSGPPHLSGLLPAPRHPDVALAGLTVAPRLAGDAGMVRSKCFGVLAVGGAVFGHGRCPSFGGRVALGPPGLAQKLFLIQQQNTGWPCRLRLKGEKKRHEAQILLPTDKPSRMKPLGGAFAPRADHPNSPGAVGTRRRGTQPRWAAPPPSHPPWSMRSWTACPTVSRSPRSVATTTCQPCGPSTIGSRRKTG